MIPEGAAGSEEGHPHVVFIRSNFYAREFGTGRFYETFIHELLHVDDTLSGRDRPEDDVEADCVAFYAANTEWVKILYSDHVPGPRCLNAPPEVSQPAEARRTISYLPTF